MRAGLPLLRAPGAQAYVPAAVWPDPRRDLSYLTEGAERSLTAHRGTVLGPAQQERERIAPGTLHVAYPIETEGEVHGTVVPDVTARPEAQLRRQGAGLEGRKLRRRGACARRRPGEGRAAAGAAR